MNKKIYDYFSIQKNPSAAFIIPNLGLGTLLINVVALLFLF